VSRRLFIALPLALVSLALPSTALAQNPRLTGTVGPGFTITLKKGTTRVRTLKAGRYTIRVSDRSNLHDFKLKGSTTKTITGVAFRGTKSVTVTLRRGTVTYFCSPHASVMKGTFRVT
jgi:plastocyanin